MAEFKIEVPIEVKNSQKSSGTSDGGSGGLGFKKLTGAVLAGNIATKVLSTALSGLAQLLEPLINVLKALFIVIFLPLMPLIVKLTEVIANLIGKMVDSQAKAQDAIPKAGGENIFADLYNYLIRPFIVFGYMIGDWLYDAIIKPVFDFGVKIGDWLFDAVMTPFFNAMKNVALWIVNLFETIFSSIGAFLVNIGVWIWEFILGGLDFIKDIGIKIWDFIRIGLDFIVDLGEKIWNIIKTPFEWLANKVSNIVNWLIDKLPSWLTGERALGGSVSTGGTYLVGERGPELFSPSTSGTIIPNNKLGGEGSVTINISGNNFNSETDMRKMVEMISRRLAQQTGRSFSR